MARAISRHAQHKDSQINYSFSMERCLQVKIHLLISQESSFKENAVVTPNVQNNCSYIDYSWEGAGLKERCHF